MPNQTDPPRDFALPPLRLERIETSLKEARYMVTLVGRNKRFMIAPMLADVVTQLQQGKGLDEAARELSRQWEKEVSPDVLAAVIEQQMLPRGMAYRAGEAIPDRPNASAVAGSNKKPLRRRLVEGQFYWRLIKKDKVAKLCSPLTVFYEPLSVVMAFLLVAATRWLMYSTTDRHFMRQLMLDFSPSEYLVSLALLLAVVLFHEFGHAAAQLRYGLTAGGVGFQLYHYLPAFFANVSASWRLKPRQRMVVDAGGIYFQSIAGSALYLLYLWTHYLPLLTTVMVADILSLVTLNPFLRFDGYWLAADALAVPNLNQQSLRMLAYYWRRLTGRGAGPSPLPIGRARGLAVAGYAVARHAFWLFLLAAILLRAERVAAGASATFAQFFSLALKGWRTGDALLITASAIRALFFSLLCLAVLTLAVSFWQRAYGAARALFKRAPRRRGPAEPLPTEG
jgi:putative peptide zinc metalloprotease protein